MATSSKRKCAEMYVSEMSLSSAATVHGVFVGNVSLQPLLSLLACFFRSVDPSSFPLSFQSVLSML